MTTVTAIAPARGWRVGLLVAVALTAGVVAVLLPPIRQAPAGAAACLDAVIFSG